jgi:hypothetical protein
MTIQDHSLGIHCPLLFEKEAHPFEPAEGRQNASSGKNIPNTESMAARQRTARMRSSAAGGQGFRKKTQ